MKIISTAALLACAAVASAQYVPVTGYSARALPAHAGVGVAHAGVGVAHAGVGVVAAPRPTLYGARVAAAAQPAHAGVRVAAAAGGHAGVRVGHAGVRVGHAGARVGHAGARVGAAGMYGATAGYGGAAAVPARSGGAAAGAPSDARSHNQQADGEVQGEGNVGQTDMDGGQDAAKTPLDKWNEARFAISQARYGKDYSGNLVPGNAANAFDGLPGVDMYEGFAGVDSATLGFLNGAKYQDAYAYNIDRLNEAIDHHLRNNPYDAHDPGLRNLELKLDAEKYRVQALNMWKWDAVVPGGTGDLGRFNWWKRRKVDTDRAYYNLQDAYDDYYYTEDGDWDTVHAAKRDYWKENLEEKGELMRLAGLPGELFAPTYLKVTVNNRKHARKHRHEAEEEYWSDPSWDNERELTLAELAEDSASWDHMARIGQFLGSGLLTNWAWYKDSQAQDEYNDIVLDHLEDEFYQDVYAGEFGSYAYGLDGGFGLYEGNHGPNHYHHGGHYGDDGHRSHHSTLFDLFRG